jgi:sulfur-carrier protein adenylyltransferase/sulfurtransferase
MHEDFVKNSVENVLSKEELERYNRQLIIPRVGEEGQKKLKNAKVLVIGAGGLGSPVTMYLAAAGIGTLGIVDFDVVSLSNLQRQVIFSTDDIGFPKVRVVKNKLQGINPNVNVKTYNSKLRNSNALDIIKDYDIVVDGTDNFSARYLINDACVLLKKPVVYGSILRFDGQVSVFDSTSGPCYRCLYPEPPPAGEVPSCEEGGVLGVLPGIIGSLQANEVIKYILGKGDLLVGRLLMFDALKMIFREIKVIKDDECPVCGKNPSINKLQDYDEFCNIKKVNNMQQHNEWEITVEELKEKIDKNEKFFLLDVREPFESQIASLGGTIIPMNSLPAKVGELMDEKDNEVIIYCRSGNRSHYAVEFLRDRYGFTKVKNLLGGVLAWSDRIDSTMKKY